MADIKVFVCCHKESEVPKHNLLFPIQVGAKLADKHFDGYLQDDTGENISEKNRSYCELTAQYWAWKNIEADYYGFFHYRRYLFPKKTTTPYILRGRPSERLLRRLGYDGFKEIISKYDLIAPKAENMYKSVVEHYADAPYHHREDIELIKSIIKEGWPEMEVASETYLSGTDNYFGNIFIMRKEIFFDYCSWLFSILNEFDNRCNKTNYVGQEYRVDGYIAERLFGIYYTFHRHKLRSLELPRVHFQVKIDNYFVLRLQNLILPPGTRVRAAVKKVINMKKDRRK